MPTIQDILEYVRSIDRNSEIKKSDPRILDTVIAGVTLPDETTPDALSWLREGLLDGWNGGVLIRGRYTDVPRERDLHGNPWGMVTCENPRRAFIKTVDRYFRHLELEYTISIEDKSRIHDSAVIGATGQGYVWDGDSYVRMPQLGGLVIERDVLIGPNATVMRGAIGDTIIQRGTIIGNSVNIGHGSRIGKNCLIVAHALIGGSAILEDHVTVWQGAMIANRVRIGKGATIGMGAVVLHDVPAGETWAGNPARKLR